MAAATLEREYTNIITPYAQITLNAGSNIIITNYGQPDWPYQFQSSTNLTTWNAVTNFYPDPMSDSFNFVSPINISQMFFRATPLISP